MNTPKLVFITIFIKTSWISHFILFLFLLYQVILTGLFDHQYFGQGRHTNYLYEWNRSHKK
jgi:hypothetical protein